MSRPPSAPSAPPGADARPPARVDARTGARIAPVLAGLDAWLETMRQPGGYGGPVAHWWQNRYRWAGPGLDWRYEGILIGYATLDRKGEPRARARLEAAAADLIGRQRSDGHLPGSRFEINPGTIGTPHEAAAALGLLEAADRLADPAAAIACARGVLAALERALFDGEGFTDRPGVPGRVPNKLATLGEALLACAERTGDARWEGLARAALDDVVRYQEPSGAVHQYAPGGGRGDGRYFPYYNARCVPPLARAARALGDARYRDAAERCLDAVHGWLEPDGSWPQIVYEGGARAPWARWYAGAADLLLAYLALGRPLPEAALARLLDSRLPSGAFPTAHGFASQVTQRTPSGPPSFRDVTPVAGWNDKALRLFSELHSGGPLPPIGSVSAPAAEPETAPEGAPRAWEREVRIGDGRGVLYEDATSLRMVRTDGSRAGREVYLWRKGEPWARVADPAIDVH